MFVKYRTTAMLAFAEDLPTERRLSLVLGGRLIALPLQILLNGSAIAYQTLDARSLGMKEGSRNARRWW